MWPILTDYRFGFIFIVILTIIISLFFIFLKISRKTQSWVDLFWIIIGSLSIINFTETNRLFEAEYRYNQLSSFVVNQKASITLWLMNDLNCRPYDSEVVEYLNESDSSLPRNSELFCNWTKDMIAQIESQNRDSTLLIYPIHGIRKSQLQGYFNSFVPIIKFYNEQVMELMELEEQIKDDSLIRDRYTYGLLILYIGISLRLSLSVYRVWDEHVKSKIDQKRKSSLP